MIYYLKNVYLSRNGCILDENLNLIEKASEIFIKWESFDLTEKISVKEYTLNKINSGNIKYLDDKEYIHTYPYHNIYVYGHLWDSFRQLKEIEENKINGNLLVGLNSNHTNDLYHHIEIFGYNETKILHCDCINFVYFIPNLIVSVDGVYMSRLSKDECDWLKNKYFFNNKKLDVSKVNNNENFKLYLSRGITNSNYRTVINDDEISDFLTKNDYIKITGKETLEEHIYYFSNATHIIGYHGAIFKNCIFCCKQPIIYEFCSKNCEKCFIDISETCEITKNHIQIPIESDDRYNTKIDMEIIKKIYDI